jgi:hypothetical protein
VGHPLTASYSAVECRSGRCYGEEPYAVWWQGVRLEVAAVLAAWRSPRGPVFRVAYTGDQAFMVAFDEGQDDWQIVPA